MNARSILAKIAVPAIVIAGAMSSVATPATQAAQTASTASCDWSEDDVPTMITERSVVYVHGWQSSASEMKGAADELQEELGSSYRVVTFDYSSRNRQWPVGDVSASCLASFISALSDAQVEADSDGSVLAVGHSMGGIALRAASKVLSKGEHKDSLAGFVTLGTPHLGSPMGGTAIAEVFQEADRFVETKTWNYLPPENSNASKCLGMPLPSGCGVPPMAPDSVSLATVGTQIYLQRRLFEMVVEKDPIEIPIFGDGIVPLKSANGYSTQVVKSDKGGYQGSSEFKCYVDTSYFSAKNLSVGRSHQWTLGSAIVEYLKGTLTMFSDSDAMDAAAEDRFVPSQILWLIAARGSNCFHTLLPTYLPVVVQAANYLNGMNAKLPDVASFGQYHDRLWMYQVDSDLPEPNKAPVNARLGAEEEVFYPSSTAIDLKCGQSTSASFTMPEGASWLTFMAGVEVPTRSVASSRWNVKVDGETEDYFELFQGQVQDVSVEVTGESTVEITVESTDGPCPDDAGSSRAVFGSGSVLVDLEASGSDPEEDPESDSDGDPAAEYGWPVGIDNAPGGFKAWIGAAAVTGRTDLGPLKWSTSSGDYVIGGDGERTIVAKRAGSGFENVGEGIPIEPAEDTLKEFGVPANAIKELLGKS